MTDGTTPITHTVDLLVGARIRLRRKQVEVSQSQLAEACGITFQQIQKYERGSNRVSASKLYEIAQHLKVPISYFFSDLPEPEVEGGDTEASRALAEAMIDPHVMDTIVALGSMSKTERVFVRNTTMMLQRMHSEIEHHPEVELSTPHPISMAVSALNGQDKIAALAAGPIDGKTTVWYGTFPNKSALLQKIKQVGGPTWTTVTDTGKSYIVRKIAEPSPASTAKP